MHAKHLAHLVGIRKFLEEMGASVSPDLTLRQLLVLATLGSTQELSQQQMLERLETAFGREEQKSNISKLAVSLGSSKEGSIPTPKGGHGLLRMDFDENDRRVRVLSLSKDGDRLLSRALNQAFPK